MLSPTSGGTEQRKSMPLESSDPWSFVRGLQPASLCDWPGKVSAVLFLGSCNLRCPTCHNAQLAWHPETLPGISKELVLNYFRSRRAWLDGIVISGGEPTCVPGLEGFCRELREEGFSVKLDSNGLKPHILRKVLSKGLIQAVAVDVKGPWPKYPALTGEKCSAEAAQKALEGVFELAERFESCFSFRCTRVPGLSPEDIEKVRSVLPPGYTLRLQDFVQPQPRVQ